MGRRRALVALVALVAFGCNKSEKSAAEAERHVQLLVETAAQDVGEVRAGLAKGAQHVSRLWKGDVDPAKDANRAQSVLHSARSKVQDLRVAKSTFFAVADAEGVVIRNDQESDMMAGKGLFPAFPKLREALTGSLVETVGAMPEARGVEGKPDGQWIAGVPVKLGDTVKGLYVTGWAWSAYAYRLEFKLRGAVKSEITDEQGRVGNEPLLYVYVVTPSAVIGSPPSPQVNANEIHKLGILAATQGGKVFRKELELTGRGFGLAAARAEVLGPDIAIAVLRSET